jgi:hypothetical protein
MEVVMKQLKREVELVCEWIECHEGDVEASIFRDLASDLVIMTHRACGGGLGYGPDAVHGWGALQMAAMVVDHSGALSKRIAACEKLLRACTEYSDVEKAFGLRKVTDAEREEIYWQSHEEVA